MRPRLLLLALLGTAGAAGTVAAHHGWGEYDATKSLRIESAIETVAPGNPHVTVTVRHAGANWVAVLAPPTRMNARGLAPEALRSGITVVLDGYPAKNGAPEMRAERITVAGKTVELR